MTLEQRSISKAAGDVLERLSQLETMGQAGAAIGLAMAGILATVPDPQQVALLASKIATMAVQNEPRFRNRSL